MVSAKIITILVFITANAIYSGAFPYDLPDSGFDTMNDWSPPELPDSGFDNMNDWSPPELPDSGFQDMNDWSPGIPDSGFQNMNDWSPDSPAFNQDNYSPNYPPSIYPQPIYPQPINPQPIYPQPIYPPNSNQGYQNSYNPAFSGGYPQIQYYAHDTGPITTVREYNDPISAPGYRKSYLGGIVNLEVGPSNGRRTGKETRTVRRKEWGSRRFFR
ncbi:GSCOCG00005983001-RA-CDS [Cotesia congregata]|uniref:Uncharacterized protein n=2 Tax=Cotesia congregata TaxID=51543 RepID=A0A8J2MW67_COTCN|nr:GSCOCG00005767001-RA-CDS [Cotesia congregata]CAD6227175.1 GSCOCG00005983001-RA-CDS [Cotesia congregata]CAG5083750.1 Protein of unknown function [Cotesia congregata]CAG5100457.1 Protein of unknown function [Cotesia congregata]